MSVYKKYIAGLLALTAVLMLACAAAVFYIDPSFHYHMPFEGVTPVYSNERYQNAGIIRNEDYDTIILGSSVTANFRPSQFNELFGGKTVKLTFPGGCFQDFDTALSLVYKTHSIKRVFWSIDPKILMTPYNEAPIALPEYLYNDNPFDDVKYLVNKDVLLAQCGECLFAAADGEFTSLDDAFTWDHKYEFSHDHALWSYVRPEWSETVQDPGAYDDIVTRNLESVISTVKAHPETEFYLFVPPYSMLFWDHVTRDGSYEAVLSLFDRLITELTPLENVRYYCFAIDEEIVFDLNNYTDEVHYNGQVNRHMAKVMASEPGLTEDDRAAMHELFRKTIETYDFDSLFPVIMRDNPPRHRKVTSF